MIENFSHNYDKARYLRKTEKLHHKGYTRKTVVMQFYFLNGEYFQMPFRNGGGREKGNGVTRTWQSS